MAQHTPGPWEWSKYAGGKEQAERARAVGLEPTRSLTNDGDTPVMGDDGLVASVALRDYSVKKSQRWQADDEERDANARLIAAAPDLLVVLEHAVARAEVANAEGNPILSAWLPDARAALAKAKGSDA